VSNGQFKKAYKEITKCIVLCANCHRIHHHNEKNPAL
jgi:predicted HNH restriction endonuclease